MLSCKQHLIIRYFTTSRLVWAASRCISRNGLADVSPILQCDPIVQALLGLSPIPLAEVDTAILANDPASIAELALLDLEPESNSGVMGCTWLSNIAKQYTGIV